MLMDHLTVLADIWWSYPNPVTPCIVIVTVFLSSFVADSPFLSNNTLNGSMICGLRRWWWLGIHIWGLMQEMLAQGWYMRQQPFPVGRNIDDNNYHKGIDWVTWLDLRLTCEQMSLNFCYASRVRYLLSANHPSNQWNLCGWVLCWNKKRNWSYW